MSLLTERDALAAKYQRARVIGDRAGMKELHLKMQAVMAQIFAIGMKNRSGK